MEKIFDFKKIEKFIHDFWKKNDSIIHKFIRNRKNFCIMMPPPNITGNLHMGHAFQQTIMDVLIRYNKMCGKNVLYQMGIDHAGIATQLLIERYLYIKEGKKKEDYKKEEFINKIWKWKNSLEKKILNQTKRLGHLINWNDIAFTLNTDFSNAVKKIFIKLYNDNLIYRKKKIIYWDPFLQTVISNLEVKNKIFNHNMWYIKYPLIYTKHGKVFTSQNLFIVVATTRPETMLGDTAIAVNSKDFRYQRYIGKFVKVPIINRIIPIIIDDSIDINIGTGCVKVTPAHDFHDYDLGINNKLLMINIFSKNGNILQNFEIFDYLGTPVYKSNYLIPKELQNKNRFVARNILISYLKYLGYLKKIKPEKISIPCGERSGVILEPMLTDQWFLSTKKLASIAIQAVTEKKIKFIPNQYTNMYLSWMNRIEDWCISRQLWWGHKIPAFYDQNQNLYVGENETKIRKKYNIKEKIVLKQESDVLDTWFSSSLWTFAALGWPNFTKKFIRFHPTNVLVCGYDIIFFWISRMIMMTMYSIKDEAGLPQIPFNKVYITGLIRDENGKKMSKSKGNVLDPLDIIDGITLDGLMHKQIKNIRDQKNIELIKKNTINNYPNGIPPSGTDAIRFTFLSLASTSRSIHWDMNRLMGYKFFCNKIWNASRFIFPYIEKYSQKKSFNIQKISIIDYWMLLKLNHIIKKYHEYIRIFRFDSLTNILYDFIWNIFCDKYLEFVKPILLNCIENYYFSVIFTLKKLFISILKFLHPVMPFITEFLGNILYQKNQISKKILILNKFPKKINITNNINLLNFMSWFKKLMSLLKNVRVELGYKKNELLCIFLKDISLKNRIFLQENNNFLKKIAYLKCIIEIFNYNKIYSSIFRIIDNVEVFIPVKSNINIHKELKRLNKSIQKLKKIIFVHKNQLLNKNFLKNAPKLVVEEKKNILEKYKKNYIKLIYQKKFLSKSNN